MIERSAKNIVAVWVGAKACVWYSVASCVLAALAWTPSEAALLASSTFTTGSEGWFIADWDNGGASPYSVLVTTRAVTWSASGGNPGGYISTTDLSPTDFRFAAPAQFLGNQAAAFGGSLQYDLFETGPVVDGSQPALFLTGAGQSLFFYGARPTSTFTSFTIPLTPAVWRIGNYLNGPQPTVAQFQAVLGSLDGLYIEGDWVSGNDFSGLDNVRLNSRVPEPSTWLLCAIGLGALFGARRKRAGLPR